LQTKSLQSTSEFTSNIQPAQALRGKIHQVLSKECGLGITGESLLDGEGESTGAGVDTGTGATDGVGFGAGGATRDADGSFDGIGDCEANSSGDAVGFEVGVRDTALGCS
jgi:hypothetical protein